MFLFDLLHFAAPCLPLIASVLTSAQLKIGKGFEMDLGQLHRAYPDPAFTRVNNLLEVDALLSIDMGIPRVGCAESLHRWEVFTHWS